MILPARISRTRLYGRSEMFGRLIQLDMEHGPSILKF
jgi:hypothetical protein